MIHVNRFMGGTVRIWRDGITDIISPSTAARLLAGLEVALAAALLEAGGGKCLHCGGFSKLDPTWPKRELDMGCVCHCVRCGGILSPMPARGEG